MKNKKFLKAIAAITLSASAALGAFGLTACGGGHSHSFKWESDATEHWKVCDCGDEEDGTRANHDFTAGDCICGAKKPGSEGPGGPEEPGTETDVLSEGLKTFLGKYNSVVYKNGFTKTETVECIGGSETAPATGIYGTINPLPSGGEITGEDFTENLKVTIADGKLTLSDVGPGTVNAFIKVEKQTLKKVHIYAEVTPLNNAGGWDLLRFLDGNGNVIASVRSNGSKKVGVSVAGDTTVAGAKIDCAENVAITVEATLDLGLGKISVKLNGADYEFTAATETNPAVTQADISVTDFSGVSLMTANGSKVTDTRNISVDNIGICTEDSEVTTEALQTKLGKALDDKFTALDVENKYTQNGQALSEAYQAGVTAIVHATTNEAVLKAYNDAVAAMDAIESDAAIALREAKEAAKTAIDGYKDAGEYTINSQELAAAVSAGKTAVDGCKTVEAVAEAETAAKAKIDAVKSDATLLADKKAEALKELNAYNGGAAKYTEEGADGNKTAYDAAIASGTNGITGVTIDSAGGAQAALDAVTAACNTAKTAIDGIKNDETLRAEAKEAAKTELAAYRAEEIAAIDATLFPNVVAGIKAIKADSAVKIDEAVNLAAIKTVSENAKDSIDSLITSTTQTFEEFKQSEKERLASYAAKAKEGLDASADAALISAIDKAVTDGNGAIDAVVESAGKDDVSAACNAAIAEIDRQIALVELARHKASAKAELVTYAETLKVQINQNTGLVAALDAYVTEQQGIIDAETTTTANLAEVTQSCKNAIEAKVDELKETKFAVTFNVDGVAIQQVTYGGLVTKPANPANTATRKFIGWYADAACNTLFDFTTVQIYGEITVYAKWQEADVTITYNVNGAVWKTVRAFSGDAATLETEVYVSNKKFVAWCTDAAATSEYNAPEVWAENQTVTLYAKLADKTNDDLALSESWIVAKDETLGTQNIKESKLYVLSTDDTVEGKVETVAKNVQKGTLLDGSSVDFNKVWRMGTNNGSGTRSKNIIITAKEDIKGCIYLSICASNYDGNRTADFYISVNETAVKAGSITGSKNTVVKVSFELTAGQVAYVYSNNTGSSGGGVVIYGIETQLSENFTNATVNYYNADHTTVFKSVSWNSLKTVTAPDENPVKEGSSLIGWTTTKDGVTADYVFDENAAVDANGVLNLYPVYESAAVTVVFHDKDGNEIKSAGVLEGGVIAEADIPSDTEVTGFKFLGWYTKTDGEFDTLAFDFTTTLGAGTYEGDTLNLYANYKELQLITVSGDENVTVDASKNNFYVEGEVTADDIAAAITLASGKEVKEYRLNNGEGEVITLPYTVTANTSIYVVTQELSQKPWKIDFTTPPNTASNTNYKNNDVINDVLTVVNVGSGCNWNKAGYFVIKTDCEVTFTTTSPAKIVITDKNSNASRYYTITNSEGTEVGKHTMNNGSETIVLPAGDTYKITAYGGECRIGSIELVTG